MREILFRGKAINRKNGGHYRTDYKNGDWVYGLIERYYDDAFPNVPVTMRNTDGVSGIDIDYTTIGQYTGLKDKNGKRIFEGDIAKFRRFENNYIGKIVFNYKTAGFEFWWNVIVGAYGEKATHTANLSVCDEIEVIGNIHDNPELFKGE